MTSTMLPKPSGLFRHWALDPEVVFLNHGSFGACPVAVTEAQREVRARMEAEPVRFFMEELEPRMDAARAAAADFVGCDSDDLAFVLNATMGVNTVARSLDFAPGDELLTSAQEYNACNNALEYAAARTGAKVVRVEPPFPVRSAEQMAAAVLEKVTARTKLMMISHITSPTGLVMPVERVVAELNSRGIDTLVDGAHGPGMLPLDLRKLGCAYYTGNFHKWVCAPKGAAFLYVRRDRQERIRPVVISHGANSPRKDRSRFRLEFDLIGVIDYTPWLTVPEAIRCVGAMIPGGWTEVMKRNRELSLAGRRVLCRAMGVEPPAPEEMIGSLAAVELPDQTGAESGQPWTPTTKYQDPLQDRLVSRHRVQVPIVNYPGPPKRLVRISTQLYNSIEQVEYLAGALKEELGGR